MLHLVLFICSVLRSFFVGVFMFSNRRGRLTRTRGRRRRLQLPICRDWGLQRSSCSIWTRPSASCIPPCLPPCKVTYTQPGCSAKPLIQCNLHCTATVCITFSNTLVTCGMTYLPYVKGESHLSFTISILKDDFFSPVSVYKNKAALSGKSCFPKLH